MSKSPAQLLKAAKSAPVSGSGSFPKGLIEYMPSIDVLRTKKGMTWDEIAAWLAENGLPRPYTASHLSSEYRRWVESEAVKQ